MVSGILIGTSYIPFPPWALTFALVPLWIQWLRENDPRKVFFHGWLTQFILTLIGFHWVAYTAREFGMLPWPVAVIVLIGFCAFASLHIPIAGFLWSMTIGRLKLPLSVQIFGLVLLTGICEQFFPMIFPWNFGYPWLWSKYPGYQWADVFGFEGLSQITFFANGLFTYAWLNRREIKKAVAAVATVIVIAVTLGYSGETRPTPWMNTDRQIRMAVVQANIGNLEKHYAQWGRGFRDKIVSEYISLASTSKAPYDLMLWPETAFPDTIDTMNPTTPHSLMLHEFLTRTQTTLLTGGYSHDLGTNLEYNGFYALSPSGDLLAPPYRKTILLAFGEYFPGGDLMPWLYKLVPTISHFGRGAGPMMMKVNGHSLGPQICYEGLYPDFSRELVNNGTDVIINVTNDSWFGTLFEPHQHLYMTLARGVENRRPVIRATNTGISTAILANGEVLEQSPIGNAWTGNFDVPYKSEAPSTFFTQYGAWFGWFEIIIFIALYGTALLKRQAE